MTPGQIPPSRVDEIHARLDAMMAEEEALLNELDAHGDPTYAVSDDSVDRTRRLIRGIVSRHAQIEAVVRAWFRETESLCEWDDEEALTDLIGRLLVQAREDV